MEEKHLKNLVKELKLPSAGISSAVDLLKEGCTVPFIARYRKEATGSLDEVAITAIRDGIERLEELDKRRNAIVSSLEERELLTEELRQSIEKAGNMTSLEDIYLPYRPKKRTKATIAREKGLAPLADLIIKQSGANPLKEAEKYLSEEKGVDSIKAALEGAKHIIAEKVSEDRRARSELRKTFVTNGKLTAKVKQGKEEEGKQFSDWFDWQEHLAKTPSHRILAMLRGESEGVLSVSFKPSAELALAKLERLFVKGEGEEPELVKDSLKDGYRRLLEPAMETEIRSVLKTKADREAISVFATNVKDVLMAPPLGRKKTMALDPGFRTGCKLVCLSETGDLLHHETIFPFSSEARLNDAIKAIKNAARTYSIEAVAIGNGTAGRETEELLRNNLPEEIPVISVNESGASIYSASKIAREEFPDLDLTYRGAVSIGRRLMDPLAELVKVDAKSIGVGQYQHDVDQKALKKSLDDVVASCVNSVGVEINTASKQLLSYVSGLGSKVAQNVIDYRKEEGSFKSRKEIMKVKGLGAKTFQQAAGFLRVSGSEHPLDNSAVHPERYKLVDRIAKDLNCSLSDLIKDKKLRSSIDPSKYISDDVGLPTIKDIISELAKPGRDPREKLVSVQFDPSIKELKDVSPGMKLQGIVTNVTAFGAFVDVGVHQDGLVHISKLSNKYIKNPHDVVKPGMPVTVKVTEVDLKRSRLSLSMKDID